MFYHFTAVVILHTHYLRTINVKTFDNFYNLLTNTNFLRVEFIVEHPVLLAESHQGECDGKLTSIRA